MSDFIAVPFLVLFVASAALMLCPLGSPRTQGKTLKAGAVLMVPAILAGVLTTACLACAR